MPEAIEPLKDSLGLKTLAESGQPPQRRVSKAKDAISIVNAVIEANKARLTNESNIQGMINGWPPYKKADLKKAALLWASNFNTLEGRATISSACVPFYDLFGSTKYCMDIKPQEGSPEDRTTFGRVISEEMQRLVRGYKGWHANIWSMIWDFVAFGKGFLTWSGPDSFRFDRILHWKVKVPDGTQTDMEKLVMVVVEQDMSAADLWAMKGKSGWDNNALVQSIQQAAPNKDTQNPFDVAQAMAACDLAESVRIPVIKLAHLYYREFGGEWSHLVVDLAMIPKLQDNQTEPDDYKFLYTGWGIYDGVHEFMAPFFFEVTTGEWNALEGLAHQIFAHMQVNDRLTNKMVTGAFQRSGLVLQAQTEDARQKTSVVQVGNTTILPPGYQVQQGTIMADLEGPRMVREELRGIVSGNTGVFRPQVEKSQGNPMTAAEYTGRIQQSMVLSSSSVDRFYDQLDPFYDEFTVRVRKSDEKEAKEFRQRCKDRGVPDEFMKAKWDVRAMRAIGSGSQALRQQAYMLVAQFFPSLPDDGKRNLIDAIIAVLLDQSHVELFNPQTAKDKLPSDDMAFATVENNGLAAGGSAQRTPHQNDAVHAQTHLLAASQIAASLEQGADPQTVLSALERIGQHTATHIDPLAADPSRKDAYKLLNEQFTQLGATVDKIKGIVNQQAQQAQADQETLAKAQAVQAGTDPEMVLKAAKTQAQMGLKAQQVHHNMALKTEQARQDMALADATTAVKIQQDNAKHRQQMAQAAEKPKGGE